MPHLDTAYNLARWLVRGAPEAQDIAQEACLRAWASFDHFRGGDARPWLLAIVRNTCYTWLRKNRRSELMDELDETRLMAEPESADPERLHLRRLDAEAVRAGLQNLPAELREVLVLREMEELSYREIADVAGLPIGTVMSRLSRARRRLADAMAVPFEEPRAEESRK